MSTVSSFPSRAAPPESVPANSPLFPADTASIAAAIRSAETHAQADRLDEAQGVLQNLLSQVPEQIDALAGLAYLAMRRNDSAAAAPWFDRALDADALRSQHAGASATSPARLRERVGLLRDASLVHQRLGNLVRSRTLLQQLVALAATPENLLALSIGHIALQEYDAAQPLLEQAIRAQPTAWELPYNLGRLLGMRGRYDDEIAAYRHALRLAPDAVPAHVNLGVALRDLHRFEEAMQSFKRAVQLDPSSASARTNRAQTNLMRGEFEHGWREYEWRWREGPQGRPAFAEDRTQWDGKASLAGKTILVYAEQGLGDTIQFARLALRLAERKPARLVLRVQAVLLVLFQAAPRFAEAGIELLSDDAPLPPFDVHAAMLSLPHLLGLRVQTIPTPIPYLVAPSTTALDDATHQADSVRDGAAAHVAQPPAAGAHRRRIGLVWRGNPQHVNDHNRSTALAQWEALLRATQATIEWVAVHDRLPEDDARLLQQLNEEGVIRDLRPSLQTFSDTAREVETLDLVVSVDSAMSHLAGAMGKPVWVVLPFTPDCRWLLDRADSPWYPHTRLFRQTRRGDWTTVLDEIEKALTPAT